MWSVVWSIGNIWVPTWVVLIGAEITGESTESRPLVDDPFLASTVNLSFTLPETFNSIQNDFFWPAVNEVTVVNVRLASFELLRDLTLVTLSPFSLA